MYFSCCCKSVSHVLYAFIDSSIYTKIIQFVKQTRGKKEHSKSRNNTSMSPSRRILVYLLRRDLRLSDNPVFHEVSRMQSQAHAPFTHLLPLYVFPAQQIETSGFISPSSAADGIRSPYPPARSQVGQYWRCGGQRAKFLAESVWDLKGNLDNIGSGLIVRVGMLQDVVRQIMDEMTSASQGSVGDAGQGASEIAAVWMTEEVAVEERREERAVRREVESRGKQFKLWKDEKYYVDE